MFITVGDFLYHPARNMTSAGAGTWYEQIWEDYAYHKTALLLLYMLFGVVTNFMVVLVYAKDKKLTGRVFILCLAIIDIVACLFVLPQTPIFLIHAQFDSLQTFLIVYRFETMALIQSYLFAQVAMSLDQFVAVYFPFKHRKFGHKLKKIMLVVALSTVGGLSVHQILSIVTNLANFPVWTILYSVVFRLVMSLSFLTLLVVYPMIVLKLYQQHHKICPKAVVSSVVSTTLREAEQRSTTQQLSTRALKVPQDGRHGPIEAETVFTTTEERGKDMAASVESARRTTAGAAKSDTAREPPSNVANLSRQKHETAQSKATRKMHVQAIKVYSSIFLLFTLSLVSLVMIILTHISVFAYVYSINHVGNPIIYYVFVPKFREAVNGYCKYLKCW